MSSRAFFRRGTVMAMMRRKPALGVFNPRGPSPFRRATALSTLEEEPRAKFIPLPDDIHRSAT